MNQPATILIVDDEPFNIAVLEQELEDLGYDTCSAANGQEALEQIAAEPPDLVLLDIMMPIMDGFTVLARLKADPATRDVLTCPTDNPNAPINGTASKPITSHNYAVNYGNTSFFQTTLNGVPFLGAPFHAYRPGWLTDSAMQGEYAQNHPDHDKWGKYTQHGQAGQPQVPIEAIPDGTSNTLLAAEIIQGQGRDLRGFTWWGGSSGFTTWRVRKPHCRFPLRQMHLGRAVADERHRAAIALGQLGQRLCDADGGRGEDLVEAEAEAPHLPSHRPRRLAPPRVQRAIEIAKGRGIPPRFGMAQQGQCLHSAPSILSGASCTGRA